MSPTRHDVLKIAECMAAMQLLEQDVSTRPLLDPATFASEVDGLLGGALEDEWLSSINAKEHAAYVQAVEVVRREVTALSGPESMRILGDWECAVFDFIMGAYSAGVRHGAAYENLRRSVVGETTTCRACRSVGITKDGNTCASCGGTGTVALRA